MQKRIPITKKPTELNNYLRPLISFENARTALKVFLKEIDLSPDEEILLPAYIGWSPNEGSGVFDPIAELGAKFRFYKVTRDLTIDLVHFKRSLTVGNPKVVLIIHYFGYPDPNLAEIVQYARKLGALIVEDEAHAFYSDWIGGVCGRFGDAAIFSIHKMLPFESGGLLLLNSASTRVSLNKLRHSKMKVSFNRNFFEYDLAGIATIRRKNAVELLGLLISLGGKVDPLYPSVPDGVVPQTLPVLITGSSRDELYFRLNESGYGVVSLYHTLIDEIGESEFPESHWLAKRILNLPVHQDMLPGALNSLICELKGLLK